MGQGQSSAGSGTDAPVQETVLKRDYYELLEVERTATEEELKKAYRRKALELHPDRNYGNVDETTKLFAEVQTAYEILSDPQERAWYDSHRDVLLRGDTAGGQGGEQYSYNVKMMATEEVLKLMLKFNGRLDYSDAPSGFYGGLNDFFQKLAKEEDIACQWEDLDYNDFPDFGTSNDGYEDVVRPFYAAWTGFATKKSYAWKDQYKLSDAPERRIRRLMEKENRKLRDEAIQEYNDAVRSLVAFVRKRDPRVRNNQKSEAERQKALREAAAAQAARARAQRQTRNEELENYVLPEWAQSRTKDDYEGGFSSESDVEAHEYDCVVCDKTFKSEAQYKAHEKSKKHIKSLKQLQREMRAEGKELELEGKDEANEIELDDGNGSQYDSAGEVGDAHSERPQEVTLSADSADEDQQSWQPTARSTNQTVRATKSPNLSDDDRSEDSGDEDDSDYAPRSEVENRLAAYEDEISLSVTNTTLSDPNEKFISSTNEDTPQISETDARSGPKVGKAKLKRAKKAAAEAAAASTSANSTAGEFSCAVCGNNFFSKTKLFNHIKEKNHAAPITQMKGSGHGKTGKGKKR